MCDHSRHRKKYSTHKRHKGLLLIWLNRQCILLSEVTQEEETMVFFFVFQIPKPSVPGTFYIFPMYIFLSSPVQVLSQFGCILGWTSGPLWAVLYPFHPSSTTQARFPPVAESVGADGWEQVCEVLVSEYFPLIVGLAQWIWRDQLEARTICTKALYFCIGQRILYILWLLDGFFPEKPYRRRISPAMTSLGI